MRKLILIVPFIVAITQMPAYAKCLKEIMSKNKVLKDVETVILNNLLHLTSSLICRFAK
jgi:predicted tellurium resistance membrane protein TerC